MFVGRKEWPVANTKTKKEKTKKAPKIGNFQNFEKVFFQLFYHNTRSLQPKNYAHMLKTMTSKPWDEIKIVKKIKMAIKLSKMKIFKNNFFLLFQCYIKPTCQQF